MPYAHGLYQFSAGTMAAAQKHTISDVKQCAQPAGAPRIRDPPESLHPVSQLHCRSHFADMSPNELRVPKCHVLP